jgi:hypothetical protein
MGGPSWATELKNSTLRTCQINHLQINLTESGPFKIMKVANGALVSGVQVYPLGFHCCGLLHPDGILKEAKGSLCYEVQPRFLPEAICNKKM